MTTASRIEHQVALCESWVDRVPAARWRLYRSVMAAALERDVRFAVGGGLVAMAYAGQWRDTKDLDLYIKPADRDRMVEILTAFGLADYYDQHPYDRNWIHRGCRDDTIVDTMWAMANQRAQVDDSWFEGPSVTIDGIRIQLLSPEHTIWTKLYVLQRDRCDWPDVLNMLYSIGAELRWQYLIQQLGRDMLLLGGLLACFRWLCPTQAAQLPASLWQELGLIRDLALDAPATPPPANLLDSRAWFTPTLDRAQLLENPPPGDEEKC